MGHVRNARLWFGVLVLALGSLTGCSSARSAATPPAMMQGVAVTMPASPRQVVIAADLAFIELNLQAVRAAMTDRGGLAVAHTPEGDVVTVTATTLTAGTSEVWVDVQTSREGTGVSHHLLDSIAAHLSVGAVAVTR